MKRPRVSDIRHLAAKVMQLSTLLTRKREFLSSAYLASPDLREAYEEYFLPPNREKINIILGELACHPAGLPTKEKLRIIDLGSGPGTGLLGVLHFFSRREQKPILDCMAIDQVSENLKIAEELFMQTKSLTGVHARLRTECMPIASVLSKVNGPCDLIILSNVLNELFIGEGRMVEKRSALLHEICSSVLDGQGTCVIIEPALRETSRELLEVRDRMINSGYSIAGPCLGKGNCPARENPKDWCHEDIAWQPTQTIAEIDRLIGLRKDSLKFSWLAIRRDGRSLSDSHTGDSFRMVSEQIRSKGKLELFICNGIERKRVVRLDKDVSPQNAELAELQRGDIVSIVGPLDEDSRFKIIKNTIVKRHRRFAASLPRTAC